MHFDEDRMGWGWGWGVGWWEVGLERTRTYIFTNIKKHEPMSENVSMEHRERERAGEVDRELG